MLEVSSNLASVKGMGQMTTRRQLNILIQRVRVDEGNPFDSFGSTPTETTTDIWARREDTQPRNEIQAGSDQVFAVNESRYTVRQTTPAWAIGDFIVDKEGQRRRVIGVSHLQQHSDKDGRMVQLLVEGYGGL